MPFLFSAYVEEAIKEINETFKNRINDQKERIKMLKIADDIVLLAGSKKDLKKVLNGMDRLLTVEFGYKSTKAKRNS